MAHDIADAVELLQRARAEHIAEVKRIDTALAALAPLTEGQKSERSVPARRPSDTVPKMSVRTKVISLAEEGDRAWSASEILFEWERRGDPIQGSNPSSAVRTALVEASRTGQIVRVEPGRYKAPRFAEPSTVPPMWRGQEATG